MCNYLSVGFNETVVRYIPPYHEQKILTLLNLKQYSPRQLGDGKEFSVLEDRVIQECGMSGASNCHTLTRTANSMYDWSIIRGYLVAKAKKGSSRIILYHHSVSRKKSGELIELNFRFPPEKYDFIEYPDIVFEDLGFNHLLAYDVVRFSYIE
ncbi:MAG: hypothetical protein ACK5C4_10275 [Pseudanabaena sp.]|jgi:hypothetical protein